MAKTINQPAKNSKRDVIDVIVKKYGLENVLILFMID